MWYYDVPVLEVHVHTVLCMCTSVCEIVLWLVGLKKRMLRKCCFVDHNFFFYSFHLKYTHIFCCCRFHTEPDVLPYNVCLVLYGERIYIVHPNFDLTCVQFKMAKWTHTILQRILSLQFFPFFSILSQSYFTLFLIPFHSTSSFFCLFLHDVLYAWRASTSNTNCRVIHYIKTNCTITV